MLSKINPTQTQAWQLLLKHFEKEMSSCQLNDLFKKDKNRSEKFSIEFENMLLDYSKNIISEKTFELLFQLAKEMKLEEAIKAMFGGEEINETERRAVLHTALRSFTTKEITVEGEDITPKVEKERNKIKSFCEGIHSGKHVGYTGKSIRHIVNIGIGGSDLGPQMVIEALKPYAKESIQTHFVNNVDGAQIVELLKEINLEESIFIVVSKSFTTKETMTNAKTLKRIFLEQTGGNDVSKHFIAVTGNQKEAVKFGIRNEFIFEIWDWVCGRFSLWSAVGLSIALQIGYDHFEQLLKGAEAVDLHFKSTAFDKNIPVVMAMLSIWYINFHQAETEAVIPYNDYLSKFKSFLQQASMESNGKSVDRSGNPVNYHTGAILWGDVGTNAQHSFFQLLHQGKHFIPADFILCLEPQHDFKDHQILLAANFFAQTEALMKGKNKEEVAADLKKKGKSKEEIEQLIPYKMFAGNKPTNSILIKKLNAYNLGSLIALYEHKYFVQGVIWNIFSFDQWGVELGKILSEQKEEDLLKINNREGSEGI